MIADFRKKPSLARLQEIKRQQELNDLRSFARSQVVGVDCGFVEPHVVVIDPGVRIAAVWHNPRTGVTTTFATPPGVATMGEEKESPRRQKRRRS